MLKINIVNRCKEILDQQILKDKQRIEELKESLADNDSSNDAEDDDGSGELMATYERAHNLMADHQRIKRDFNAITFSTRKSTVQEGALVTTINGVFLIAISLGEVSLEDGTKCYVISHEAPIYKAMKGLQAGDNFIFNDLKRTITAIS